MLFIIQRTRCVAYESTCARTAASEPGGVGPGRGHGQTAHIENHALGMLITYGLIVATAETKALQLLPAQECLCWNSAYETIVLQAKLSYLYTIPSFSAITLRLKRGYENRSRNLAPAVTVEELGTRGMVVYSVVT